jgi:hypothetical protein
MTAETACDRARRLARKGFRSSFIEHFPEDLRETAYSIYDEEYARLHPMWSFLAELVRWDSREPKWRRV